MMPRYGTNVLAGGLLAAVLALAAPVAAENPLTPLRPVQPAKSADGVAASSEPATVSAPSAPAAAAATAPSSMPAMPGAANIADADAPDKPRARRASRRAAGGIKPGRWEFTARLETPTTRPASMAGSVSAAQPAGGGMQTTYTTCIQADNAVPADLGPQCRLERHDRRGSRISWSMSCSNTGVRSDGRAQYRGDTMQAAVVSHIPGASGRVTDMTQHLTGRYLGPCLPPTAAMLPTGAPPPINAATGDQPPKPPDIESARLQGAAVSGPAPTLGSTTTPASPAPTASEPPKKRLESSRRHLRHGRHAHRAYRRHRSRAAYRAWYGGSSFGPNPISGAGP
jgi:hypothetical protein